MDPIEERELEIREMRLELIDLLSTHISALHNCVEDLRKFDDEIIKLIGVPRIKLIGVPRIKQKQELNKIAQKVIASYKRKNGGGRKDA